MTVLYIIGILAIAFALLMVVVWINALSEKRYGYEFFSYGNFALTTVAYVLIFFGRSFYLDAVSTHGDILNGILMVGIGVVIVLGILIYHTTHTSVLFGLFFGMIQLAIYVPAGVVSFFILIVAVAWLSDTKPVYEL